MEASRRVSKSAAATRRAAAGRPTSAWAEVTAGDETLGRGGRDIAKGKKTRQAGNMMNCGWKGGDHKCMNNSFASRRKPNSAPHQRTSDVKVDCCYVVVEDKGVTGTKSEGVDKGQTNVHLGARSSGAKSGAACMHFVTSHISELQTSNASRGNATPSALSPRRSSDLKDIPASVDGYKSRVKGDRRVDAECYLVRRAETPKKLFLRRYSGLPPPAFLKVEGGGNLPKSTMLRASSSAAVAAPRSSPALSFKFLSCAASAPGSELDKTTKQGAHLFFEDGFGGLRPGDGAHLKQQLLARCLASPEEAERTATVVFDLDETLCNNRGHGPAKLRPGAIKMLKELRAMYPHPVLRTGGASSHAPTAGRDETTSSPCCFANGVMLRLELILWTASTEAVARPVIARLDCDGSIFDEVIYRDVRWYLEGGCAKDLRRIGRDLERIIIVENAPSAVCLNRENAILVNDFVKDFGDRQLFIVQAILQEWLENVNAFLVNRHFFECASCPPRRHATVQDGGESPEPDPFVHSECVLAQCSASPEHCESEASSVLLQTLGGSCLLEMKRDASCVDFLAFHPFLSPATRYVKSSAWKKALQFLRQGVMNIPTADAAGTNERQKSGNENGVGRRKIKSVTSCSVPVVWPRRRHSFL